MTDIPKFYLDTPDGLIYFVAAPHGANMLMLKRIEALRDANTVYVPDGTTILTGASPK